MKKNRTIYRFLILNMLIGCGLHSQNTYAQIITTYAGSATTSGYSGDGGPATAALASDISGMVMDPAGTLFFTDEGNGRIRKIDASGIVHPFAGNGSIAYTGDGGPATAAAIYDAAFLARDGIGNIYASCAYHGVIRKITSSGIITTVAGIGLGGYSGDGGPATAAGLDNCAGIAFDGSDNLYIADSWNDCIRKVDHSTGIISTIAGIGLSPGYSGDGGPATAAQIWAPLGIHIDKSHNILYIAEFGNSCIRTVDLTAGIISTFAGTAGTPGYSGDGGPATTAELYDPGDVTQDWADNVYIADGDNNVIRKVDPSGIISTFCGTGALGWSGDGGPATAAELAEPENVIVDCGGRVFVTCEGTLGDIRMINTNHTPLFTAGGSININICRNSSAVPINTLLEITDADAGQPLGWGVSTGPSHGTLGGFPESGTSTGGILLPSGLTYTPTPGYTGSDIFKIAVTDCGDATSTITVNVSVNTPPAAINGMPVVCVGLTTALTDATGGGSWSSGNTSVATIGSGSGIVTGIAAGTATVTYDNGCTVTTTVTVNPIPDPISRISTVCVGSSILLSDPTAGGSWSSSNTLIATADLITGLVTGISIGTTTITYTTGMGCFVTAPVTVTTSPSAIMGTLVFCVGSTTTLSNSITDGSWSSSNTLLAPVDPSTGVVSGLDVGTAVITYTNYCGSVTATVTINLTPTPIAGTLTVCSGSITTLTDAVGGGVWSSDNTSIATVGSSTGDVTGISDGTATITYLLGSGCYTTTTVTVSGEPEVCVYSYYSPPGPAYYTFSGVAGATIYFSEGICYGCMIYGYSSYTLTSSLDIFNPPVGLNRICIDSVEFGGCIWAGCSCPAPLNCCASLNPLGYRMANPVGTTNISPSEALQVSIKPNPNSGEFLIEGDLQEMNSSKNVKIEVLDMLGRSVYGNIALLNNGAISTTVVLSDDVPNGIYLLKVRNNDVSKVTRFTLKR